MSLKTRGQETVIQIAVGGVVRRGSMVKVISFSAKPRQEIKEDDHLGEDETDLDFQQHGWDLSWEVNTIDSEAIDLVDEIIDAEKNHEPHPDMTLTEIIKFREPNVRAKAWVYHELFVMTDETGASSRKDNHKVKFSAKAKRRTPMTV